jgi:hypothetical protein
MSDEHLFGEVVGPAVELLRDSHFSDNSDEAAAAAENQEIAEELSILFDARVNDLITVQGYQDPLSVGEAKAEYVRAKAQGDNVGARRLGKALERYSTETIRSMIETRRGRSKQAAGAADSGGTAPNSTTSASSVDSGRAWDNLDAQVDQALARHGRR